MIRKSLSLPVPRAISPGQIWRINRKRQVPLLVVIAPSDDSLGKGKSKFAVCRIDLETFHEDRSGQFFSVCSEDSPSGLPIAVDIKKFILADENSLSAYLGCLPPRVIEELKFSLKNSGLHSKVAGRSAKEFAIRIWKFEINKKNDFACRAAAASTNPSPAGILYAQLVELSQRDPDFPAAVRRTRTGLKLELLKPDQKLKFSLLFCNKTLISFDMKDLCIDICEKDLQEIERFDACGFSCAD